MKKAGFVLACSLSLALSPGVRAETSGRAPAAEQVRDPATAEALFRQGRQAMEAKDFQQATQKFAESQRLDPAAGTLMNLATSEEKVGRLASAWQHWKEAIDSLPVNDDRIAFAQSRVQDLEKKLPRLQVTLGKGASDGAKVYRDEIELGPAGQGVPLPVDPGPHTVTVRMPGRFSKSTTISVGVGEQAMIDVQPGAVDPSAGTVAAKGSAKTIGWIVGGVGVVGIGTAAVTGMMLVGIKRTVSDNCDESKVCNQDGLDAAANGKKLIVANAIGWGVGAVGLGVGAYLILSAPKAQPAAVLAPSIGPGSASLTYVGRF